jgi:prefoldin subunit 5
MMNEVQKLDIRVTGIEKTLAELQERLATLERASRRSKETSKGFASKGTEMVTRKAKH